jgi:hypothetical protein
MSECFQCKMQIPIGANVCPFCRSDPRSDIEKAIINAGAAGLSKAHANKTGNIILQMIFFGVCLGVIGFVFTDSGFVWLIVGVFLGYLNSKWMNRNK